MKSEIKIRQILDGMKKHQHYIRDDYQRFGYDNFMSALEFVLGDNEIIDAVVENQARVFDDLDMDEIISEEDLKVGYVHHNRENLAELEK